MAKGLFKQHGIPVPCDPAGFGPAATISVLHLPGGLQRLQVTMPEPDPDHFAMLDTSYSSSPRHKTRPQSNDRDVMRHLNSGHPSALPPLRSRVISTKKDLSPRSPAAPNLPTCHPHGLDAAQVGIDFVLTLESPCLDHTKNDLESSNSYGHILTAQAPLLTNRLRSLKQASSWTVPAVEIERLLNLSSQLNLAGELTPVQAWSRIRAYPGFEKLNLDRLEILKQALLQEVQCYGYACMDSHRTLC